ncbi:unnamed protein product, partial [Penicillium egyptiacum]
LTGIYYVVKFCSLDKKGPSWPAWVTSEPMADLLTGLCGPLRRRLHEKTTTACLGPSEPMADLLTGLWGPLRCQLHGKITMARLGPLVGKADL